MSAERYADSMTVTRSDAPSTVQPLRMSAHNERDT